MAAAAITSTNRTRCPRSWSNTSVEGGFENEDAYAGLLDQIADYICAKLPAAAPHAQVPNPAAAPDVVTVFVAKVADDMYPAYDKVVTELKTQGMRVVIDPEQDLPNEREAAEAAVVDALQGAKLAVHLLGHEPGPRIGDKRLDGPAARSDPRGNCAKTDLGAVDAVR